MKSILSFLVFSMIFQLSLLLPATAQTDNTAKAEKAKQSAQKILKDDKNIVKVKLKSGQELKGRITSITENTFVLLDTDSNTSQTISFADVDQIKKSSKGLGISGWIVIGAVATIAAVIAGVVIAERCNEMHC